MDQHPNELLRDLLGDKALSELSDEALDAAVISMRKNRREIVTYKTEAKKASTKAKPKPSALEKMLANLTSEQRNAIQAELNKDKETSNDTSST